MGLLDSVKRAEEQGREASRSTLQRAEQLWEDAERRLRRRMRVHPPRRLPTSSTSLRNTPRTSGGIRP